MSIQNVEFEVSNTNGSWNSIGSDQNPQYLKSVTLKFKTSESSSAASSASEEALRAAVKAKAEEKCRLIAVSDRPADLPASVSLRMTADISSQKIYYVDQQFTGKYICAVYLKP